MGFQSVHRTGFLTHSGTWVYDIYLLSSIWFQMIFILAVFFYIKKFCFEWVSFSNKVELEYQESKGNFLFIYFFFFKIPLFLCPPLSNAHHPRSDRLTDCGLTDQGCGLSDGLSVCGRH